MSVSAKNNQRSAAQRQENNSGSQQRCRKGLGEKRGGKGGGKRGGGSMRKIKWRVHHRSERWGWGWASEQGEKLRRGRGLAQTNQSNQTSSPSSSLSGGEKVIARTRAIKQKTSGHYMQPSTCTYYMPVLAMRAGIGHDDKKKVEAGVRHRGKVGDCISSWVSNVGPRALCARTALSLRGSE